MSLDSFPSLPLAQAAEGGCVRDLTGGPPASLLPGTSPCCTHQPRDMLHCLGGMAVLLPLLGLLDPPAPAEGEEGQDGGDGRVAGQEEGPGREAAAEAVRLVAAMAEGCAANAQALRQINGAGVLAGGWSQVQLEWAEWTHLLSRMSVFQLPDEPEDTPIVSCGRLFSLKPRPPFFAGVAIMGHLLLEAHPRHRTHDLVSAAQALLGVLGSCEELAHDALRHLLLNLQLWHAAPAEVQAHLLTVLLQLAQVCGWCFL